MKNWTTILSICFIPIISYPQWYDLPNVPHGRCDAVDSLIVTGAYRVNSSWVPDSLYMTTDGGSGWFAIPLPYNLELGDGPTDISIKGADKIWFCTGNGKIFSTTNAGLNRQLQFYDTLLTKFMNYLEMFDEMNGIAMGDAPADDEPTLFLKTTNGGEDWVSQNDSELISLKSGNIWRRVDFANMDVGYFYNYQAFLPTIYKSTNSGKNWHVINDTIPCNVLKAYDENILLVEHTNIMYRTFDGGQTWESSPYDSLGWALDIEFIPGNPSNVWCGIESVNFSSDTGRTWAKEFYLEYDAVYDMVFTDENSGWIYAGGGGILTHMFRTTNGGHGGIVSVDENDPGIILKRFKLEQNYPNPFNPRTNIGFRIANFGFVTLMVYDILGNEVTTLVNEELSAGNYEIELSGNNFPSGVYFYQLSAQGPEINSGQEMIQTKKMILLK